jgi:UDP-glucuronate decarboxylase
MDQKCILITGGAGFIGSNLCERLLFEGHCVICLDNYVTGSKHNIRHLNGLKHFKEIDHDVTIPIYIEADVIYNLACPASPKNYQLDPVATIKTNIYGAINMLELARYNDAQIFQASTSEIYGDSLIHPQKEDYWGNVNPTGVRACYAEGKRCAETLFFDYHRLYNMEIKVVRIFNTYGPRMQVNDGRVVSNFIVKALKGEDVIIYGDGSQTRSFCYIDDLIDAFIAMMGSKKIFTGPVNLGNTHEISIKTLAKMIINITNSRSNIKHRLLPEDDPSRRLPDISFATSQLKWEPVVTLEAGLKKTIDYFDNLFCRKGKNNFGITNTF